MALEKITEVRGRGVYVPGNDIDTDRIIPARFMKCVTFDGLGEYLFYDVRHESDGSPKPHPLNDPKYAGATILISGANFGCGSSREHAPQAIYRQGFRAVIAEGFAEIFFGNSITLGMPCLSLSHQDLLALASAVQSDPQAEIVIDVTASQIRVGDRSFSAGLRESARNALIHGRWDAIGDLLEGADQVRQLASELPYMTAR